MMMLAVELPKKPPAVYVDVRRENVASDIGMHVGKPWLTKGGAARQVNMA
jgi:hypothetical protein